MAGDWLWNTGPNVLPTRVQPAAKPLTRQRTSTSGDFNGELEKAVRSQEAKLAFSAHAMERLRQRNLHLSEGDVKALTSAVNKIAEKGGRESLIMYRNTAFVVSIDNRKVITAMPQDQMKNNVFTNIDSAMML